MNSFLTFILIAGVVVFVIFIIKMYFNNSFVYSKFRKGNCIVFGVKGAGKDLLFHKVANIYVKNKKRYVGNMNYTRGKNFVEIPLNQFSVAPNNFRNFITSEVQKIPKPDLEELDFFLSDGGVYLASHEDSFLTKYYKSLPVTYALSRHLFNSNFHVNTQAYGRLWIKIREQADSYFKVLKTIKWTKIFGYFFLKVRYYSEVSSAEKSLLPMKFKVFNKFAKGLYEEFEATNGIIREFLLPIKIKKITYDTRYFHEVVFGEKSPQKKKFSLFRLFHRKRGLVVNEKAGDKLSVASTTATLCLPIDNGSDGQPLESVCEQNVRIP